MTFNNDEKLASQPSDDESITIQAEFTRQNSYKRLNSDDDQQVDIDHIPFKRGRVSIDTEKSTVHVPCPIADFGCLRDVPSDELKEHYSSLIHQQCLMKTIAFYEQQLHNTSEKTTDNAELCETVDILAEGVSSLHDENMEIHSNVAQLGNTLGTFQNKIQTLQSSIEETNQFVQASQISQSFLVTEMESLREKMTELSSQSFNDGTFIWKITNVADKISDAIADRQTSIYSPPFYSSPTGYKMCMRLYMNGDGQARRTHLSLFFVILRGDYDAVLQWPFAYKITFCLYDQTNNKNHIIDSFRTDTKSNSFQRPRSNMNIASGIPRFCPLTQIQQANSPYVRDDCMFIRCMVDFANMSKAMIPYVCNLNPGLPISVQRKMYQAENERRNAANPETSTETLNSKSETNEIK